MRNKIGIMLIYSFAVFCCNCFICFVKNGGYGFQIKHVSLQLAAGKEMFSLRK